MIKKTLFKVDRPAVRALPIGYAGVLYDLLNFPDTVWEIEPFRVGAGFCAPWSAYVVELHMIAGNRRLVWRSAVTRWRTQERARQAKELRFYSTFKPAPEGVA